MSTVLNTAENRLPKATRIAAPVVAQPVLRPRRFTVRHPEMIITALVVNIAAALVALMVLMASPVGHASDYHDTVAGDTNPVAMPVVPKHVPNKAATEKAAVTVPNVKLGKQAAAWLKQYNAAGQTARMSNIKFIVDTGLQRRLKDPSIDDTTIAIVVGTCMQESSCMNWKCRDAKGRPTCDADSAGLLQGRPSVKAWGTYEQIINRKFAINMFYDKLLWQKDRHSRPMMVVAANVQIPSHAAYWSTWKWDQIAPQFVKYYSSNKGK